MTFNKLTRTAKMNSGTTLLKTHRSIGARRDD
jgi:hypothetical protein